MDKTDRELISILRGNARASISELSGKTGLSRSTVRARMDRLQNRGDIVSYTVVLREDLAAMPVRGLMMIGIAGPGTARILRQVTGMTEVRAVHSTNGRWDAILEIGTDTLESFDKVLNRVREINGVTESETSLLLDTKKRA